MSKTGKKAAILLDTKGPESRTIKLEGGNDVSLKAGQTFTFTTDKSRHQQQRNRCGNL